MKARKWGWWAGWSMLVLPLVGMVLFGLAVVWPRPDVMEGTDRPPWLPAAAREVFWRSQEGFGWWKAAEFTIAESDLRAWCYGNGWEIAEELDVSPPGQRLVLRQKGELPTEDDFTMLPRALVYERRASNGGGVTLYFNPVSSRAFFFESHR